MVKIKSEVDRSRVICDCELFMVVVVEREGDGANMELHAFYRRQGRVNPIRTSVLLTAGIALEFQAAEVNVGIKRLSRSISCRGATA